MNSFNRVLAAYQFRLSLLILVGYFGLVVFTALKMLDPQFVKDATPFVMLVVMYWFQRQRHQDDPTIPTQPPLGANNGVKS